MTHLIPSSAIERYTSGPSNSTVSAVKSLHENVRSVLGGSYETFLQGSYRNDTAVANLNDVDIVALRTSVTSTYFTGTVATDPITWDTMFQQLQNAIEAAYEYRGKTKRGDKCITINTNFKADVVPAIKIANNGDDPIAVFSFREDKERKNYPRIHYQNNVSKQSRTNSAYKPTVRMFKNWARNWFQGTKIAPSFYVECLVHTIPDTEFRYDGAASFFLVAHYIVNNISRTSVVNSVAGDKDILVSSEWDPTNFEKFHTQLDNSLSNVAQALSATSSDVARSYWWRAFNE